MPVVLDLLVLVLLLAEPLLLLDLLAMSAPYVVVIRPCAAS